VPGQRSSPSTTTHGLGPTGAPVRGPRRASAPTGCGRGARHCRSVTPPCARRSPRRRSAWCVAFRRDPEGFACRSGGRRLRVRPVAAVGEAVSLARASDVRTTGRRTNGPAPPRRAGPFACVERAARRGIRTDEPPAARSPGATSATRRWRHPVRSGP
jgi:hypothetical protein